jgi:hypothetical protein
MSNGVNQELKHLIEDYFLKYPHMSINALSKRTLIGATTLRRILSLSLKGGPNPKTVLNLMSVLTKEKNITHIIEKSPQLTKTFLFQSFNPYLEGVKDPLSGNFLKNNLKFIIFKLASNQSGVHFETISTLYGENGLKVLRELTKEGYLIKEDNFFHSKDKNKGNNLHFKASHFSNLLPLLKKYEKEVETYKKGPQEKDPFHTLSESLNEEGIKKITQIQKEALKKIKDIMKCPSHSGTNHFFSIQLGGVLKAKH